MIGTVQNQFDARRPDNTSGSAIEMQMVSSLHMNTFVLSRIDSLLLLACTANENSFLVTGILYAIFVFVGRLGTCSSPCALACIIFLVVKMTLRPLGVITSL